MSTDELFEFGDADLVLIIAAIGLEKRMQAIQDGGLPMGEKLRLDVVLATEFCLANFAAQQFENEPSLEIGGKGPTSAWHKKISWHGPVRVRLLVQRQGRTT